MANLVSPGVSVSIIDQSQYLPGASSSVPLIVVATAQNKINGAGTGVATATTAANANKLQLLTSQRDLTTLFGSPFFYKTSNGTPIHGYELNEYGLLAAYSVLGVTNRAYVLRADVDLGALVGTLSRPVGAPTDGTYWLDTTNSTWGIYEFNATTGKFTNKLPIVLTDSMSIVGGYPKDSIGSIGSYAVIPSNITTGPYTAGTFFYKNSANSWTEIGSYEWKKSLPVAQSGGGSVVPGTFSIQARDTNVTHTVTVDSGNTLTNIKNTINGLGDAHISADVISGKLCIYYSAPTQDSYLTFTDGTGTPLAHLGGIPTGTPVYAPDVSIGTSANMPLWSASQQYPHPTGSVWIKTSVAGSGMNVLLSKYSGSLDSYSSVATNLYQTSLEAICSLDSTGGKNIPVGTVIGTYYGLSSITGTYNTASLTWYKRKASGPTVVRGTNTNVSFTQSKQIVVGASQTSVSDTTQLPRFTINCTGNAEDFVTAWQSTNIPFTTAEVASSGEIVLTHTLGGEIYLTDYDTHGHSNGALEELGFISGINAVPSLTYLSVYDNPTYTTTNGVSAQLRIINRGTSYKFSILDGHVGTGFAAGDTLTITGQQLGGTTANNLVVKVTSVDGSGGITGLVFVSGFPKLSPILSLSNWELLNYVANEGAPAALPANGTAWYYSTPSQVDIMVNVGGSWMGYGNAGYDDFGFPAHGASNATDPTGVIVSALAPATQVSGADLVPGDIWLNSADLENYPALSRWEIIDTVPQWVAIDNTDQTSSRGILFADARWAVSGAVDPVNDPMSSIAELVTSDYLDLDAPDATLYPQGMILFNTRRSGYNVKKFTRNYFTQAKYPNSQLPTGGLYTWVSASGLKADGSAYMGRKAQRAMVVHALKAAIGTNMSIREEDTFFNLIVTPGYPELQPDMVGLNNERNNTAYIIGDTPLRLDDQATNLTNWATNAMGATGTGEDGLVTRDQYMGIFYPSGITSDTTGADAVVPASHMMLRTFIRNDTVAYPWLAAAGTRRGNIDNATNIGYINATTGEFQTVKNRMGIRDVLYTNQINPLAFFTGVGLLNYGNKNSQDTQSAMDRTNVARLVAYIRDRLQVAARPFVFEPNDALTRGQLTAVVQSLFVDLVAKRGLYDYLVVCDETNNTPARIDRNELWIDVAIEPVKAAEFIYIPVRILNTGEIASLK